MNYLGLLFIAFSFQVLTQSLNYNTKHVFITKGYDVVSYSDNEPKKRSESFTKAYNGVKFKFLSQT